MSLKEYFSTIQQCIDAFTSVGKIIPTEDNVLYLLVGLGDEYESIVTVISSQFGLQSIAEVQALLLSHEIRLENKNASVRLLFYLSIIFLV